MKYIVWVREGGYWYPNGDGPLTKKQAERIAREVRQECRVNTKVLPVKNQPRRSQHEQSRTS